MVAAGLEAQVTRLSNNTSFAWGFPLPSGKLLLHSEIDKSISAYDIAGNSFVVLSNTVVVEDSFAFGYMNGKFYFAGKTTNEGIELWATDGTPGGTAMVKDINNGPGDSNPKYGFIVYNNELYFTADDGTTGRELWKTNGTQAGTVRVKDINTGTGDGFNYLAPPSFAILNNQLLFSAVTAADGDELWKTDGSESGTTQVKSIFTGTSGSHISGMTLYNGSLIFTAYDNVNGQSIWKTDGSTTGTVLVANLFMNPPIVIPPFPPFYVPSIMPPFFSFQNNLYFAGNDGTHGFELWKTDGTGAGTVMVKDIDPSTDGSGNPKSGLPFLQAVKNDTKFFFSAQTVANGSELWQSDGSGAGTSLFTDIAPGNTSSEPLILPPFSTGLFQGSKFFFIASTPGVQGEEFYVSDGTTSGTQLLKDINPGAGSGYDGTHLAWYYTDSKFYFVADDGVDGNELWQSDGNPGSGTTMVADVNTNPGQGSNITFATVAANTLFFFGTDGDAGATDFFKLDGNVSALPLLWTSVEARPVNHDVQLIWKTAAEELTSHFVVQRSENGSVYQDIGKVQAVGSGANTYTFTDAGAMNAGVRKWLYRIKYVDKDAHSAYSRIMSVMLNKLIASLQVAPNPARNELKLTIEAVQAGPIVLRVIDATGQAVIQQSGTLGRGPNTISLGIGRLATGAYLVQVLMDGGATTERFVVQ
jgi:ELWxxDGT repeat protein